MDGSTPAALFAALASIRLPAKQQPQWLDRAALPPLTAGGQALDDVQIAALLEALRQSSFAQPHPVVPLTRAQADPASLQKTFKKAAGFSRADELKRAARMETTLQTGGANDCSVVTCGFLMR